MFGLGFLAILGLLICIICAIVFRIQGANIALALICLVFVAISLTFPSTPLKTDNTHCITSGRKHYAGLLAGGCLDVWHITHVLFWALLGIVYPDKMYLAFALSVAWEVFEHVVFKYFVSVCNSLFCGRVEDVMLNMIGYAIGSIIATYYVK